MNYYTPITRRKAITEAETVVTLNLFQGLTIDAVKMLKQVQHRIQDDGSQNFLFLPYDESVSAQADLRVGAE